MCGMGQATSAASLASVPPVPTAPFGTLFAASTSTARWDGHGWGTPVLGPVEPLALHPGTHALHYGSSCFEGLKAHRGADGVVRIFRLDRHAERLQASAASLALPVPPVEMVKAMVVDVVRAALPEVPAAPGSLYLRPTLIGSEVNIGAAGHPSHDALFFVLASPVGDYFTGGDRPLTLAVETQRARTAPGFGTVKTGANYAMALRATMQAHEQFGADQVLFAPGGLVEETGASNFVLLDDERIVTPALTTEFLHGVTRDSLLRLGADMGYRVEERALRIEEVREWAARPGAEAALSGTAAVLAGVGALADASGRTVVGSGQVGPNTVRLRAGLLALQRAEAPDPYGWTTPVQ